jgi:hypothetical protein
MIPLVLGGVIVSGIVELVNMGAKLIMRLSEPVTVTLTWIVWVPDEEAVSGLMEIVAA